MCSSIYHFDSEVLQRGAALLKQVRQCVSVRVLCPMIRQLRELQSQQPTECKVTVTSTGDIVVQSHKFAYGLWSSLLSVLKVH